MDVDHSVGRSIEPYAAKAYLLGWLAASPPPRRRRFERGLEAALTYAVANYDNPHVLEATLHIGHLEGVWATIFDRRTSLYDSCMKAVADAWRELVASVDLSSVVRAVRSRAGLAEAKRDETTAQYATTLVLSLLQGLMTTAAWMQLRTAVSHALASGAAEGQADAMALLADRVATTRTFNFDQAFQDAYNDLGTASPMAASVDTWLGQLVNLVAQHTGNNIAQSVADGDNYDETLDDSDAVLTVPDQPTTHYVDYLVHMAITAGILWWYRRQGVAQVYVITAGDEKVCPLCDQYEGNSPYAITDVPDIPAHPRCRCTLWTDDSLPASLIDAYL